MENQYTLQNTKSISFLIQFYTEKTKDYHNENLNDLTITNQITFLKLSNKIK